VPTFELLLLQYQWVSSKNGLNSESRVSVEFAWLGGASGPGAQPFEVYDPITLDRLDSGTTVSALAIPAPGSLWLIGAGALSLLVIAQRRRLGPAPDGLPHSRRR
jgi:hypothetical protein